MHSLWKSINHAESAVIEACHFQDAMNKQKEIKTTKNKTPLHSKINGRVLCNSFEFKG